MHSLCKVLTVRLLQRTHPVDPRSEFREVFEQTDALIQCAVYDKPSLEALVRNLESLVWILDRHQMFELAKLARSVKDAIRESFAMSHSTARRPPLTKEKALQMAAESSAEIIGLRNEHARLRLKDVLTIEMREALLSIEDYQIDPTRLRREASTEKEEAGYSEVHFGKLIYGSRSDSVAVKVLLPAQNWRATVAVRSSRPSNRRIFSDCPLAITTGGQDLDGAGSPTSPPIPWIPPQQRLL